MKFDNNTLCSIIIRCYNEEEHIGRLLTGIMQQKINDYEIILVDSGSTDATLSIASRYPVKIVYISPEEFSFGRALNKGCEAAEGEFLIFISAHCWPVYHDWLEQMIEPFQDPKIALVYGKQRGNEITKFSEHQIFASWFPNKSNFCQDHPFCNNANCAIRKDIWEKMPYNEELTGLEDLDWAKRTIDAGYRITYSAKAEIIHVHQETPKRVYNRYRREAIALKEIYPEEKFTILDFIRLSTINIFADWYEAYQNKLMMKNFCDIIIFRVMHFWGAYKGFGQRDPVSKRLKQTFYYPNSFQHSKLQEERYSREGQIDYNRLEAGDIDERQHN